MSNLIYRFNRTVKSFFTHLYLSVSSFKFYQRLYLDYSGSGIRYLLNASLFISMLYSFNVLYKANTIIVDLKNDNSANDCLFKQIPDIKYDGKLISTSSDHNLPIILSNASGLNIAALDFTDKLSLSQMAPYKMIFKSDQLLINVRANKDGNKLIPIKYELLKFFLSGTYDSQTIKILIIDTLKALLNYYLYIGFFFMIIIISFMILLNTALLVLVLYILMSFFKIKTEVKDCFRIAIFAICPAFILQELLSTLTLFTNINFSNINVNFIQLWCFALLIYALVSLKNQD